MYEINLVPDVKAQLLQKQRMRNLVIFVSIIVAVAAAGVVALLGSIVTGQNIAMANQDKEIECRLEGADDCDSSYGTAILKIANINEFLTIQDQMSKLSEVNENRMMLSRVFGLLDVILPTGDEEVGVSEMVVDLQNSTLNFDAQGNSKSNIDYKALEVFKSTVALSYYDFGRYMRYDDEAGDFVEIPTTCIDEKMENGVLYGIYHKGTPGCEAPLIAEETEEETTEDEATEDETATDENSPEGTETENSEDEATPATDVVDIKILRDYKTEEDKNKYKETEHETDSGRYYFESQCVVYGEGGKIDENAMREKCAVTETEGGPEIRDSSNGRDSEGALVLRFSSTLAVNREIFLFKNKHMRVIGPSRQNVTDSYTQIRNMFTERAENCNPDDADYEECMKEVPSGN